MNLRQITFLLCSIYIYIFFFLWETHEVIDDVEFVIEVIFWVDFLVTTLPHMIHQHISVSELFFTKDTLIAEMNLLLRTCVFANRSSFAAKKGIGSKFCVQVFSTMGFCIQQHSIQEPNTSKQQTFRFSNTKQSCLFSSGLHNLNSFSDIFWFHSTIREIFTKEARQLAYPRKALSL